VNTSHGRHAQPSGYLGRHAVHPTRSRVPKLRTAVGLALLVGALLAPWGAASAIAPAEPGAESLVVNGGVQVSLARVVVPMAFPVVGTVHYRDTFLACRSANCDRKHVGQDLIGNKMTPEVAVFDGRVTYLQRGMTPAKTNYVTIRSLDNRWTATYIHVNNDTPGTDDGRATNRYGFLPGLRVGQYVVRGQFLAFMGDSGDAEDSVPHLHFELHAGDAWRGVAYNPKPSLDAAQRLSATVTAALHPAGTLIRAGSGAVYRVTSASTRTRVPTSFLPLLGRSMAHVIAVSAREATYYRVAGAEPIPSGLVVRDQHGRLCAAVSGRRYSVSTSWLRSVGLSASAVRPVTDADLASMALGSGSAPTAVREGAAVRVSGGPIYRVLHGRLTAVTTFYREAENLGLNQVAVVSRAALSRVPAGPAAVAADGTVVCASSRWIHWVVYGGAVHYAQDPTFLAQYGWGHVPCVHASDRELALNVPNGSPIYP
jgi:hypothetical protein